MAQNLFPRTNEAGDLFDAGAVLTFYTDSQGKNLATISSYPANVAIPGAVVVTGAGGVIPQFLGSAAGEKVLYAKVQGTAASQPLVQVNGEPVGGTSMPSAGGRSAVVKSSAGAAADGQTLRSWTGKSAVLTAGATVNPQVAGANYVVPAGSTFYITDLYVSGNTSTQFEVQVTDGSVTQFYGIAKGDTAPIEMPGLETQPSIGPGGTLTLILGTAAATNAYYYIAGYEQANVSPSY